MKLALIRHGITDWNLEKRIQGRTDQPLSEQGSRQMQAYAIPHSILNYRWYCSPLLRARQSAELLGVDTYELDQALVEMSWGDWEGEILKPLRKQLGEVMRDNEKRGLDFCPPNGESPRQVQQRLQHWLSNVALADQDIAVIAHKGIIRCIYAMAFAWDMRGESPVKFAWDAIHQFELSTEGRLVDSYETIPLRNP